MAVQCAQPATIEYVLFELQVDPNLPETDFGNSPLHLAVSTNRIEAAQLLLSHPAINDTIANKEGKTPDQYITSYEMMQILQKSHNELRALIQKHLDDFEAQCSRGVSASDEETKLVEVISRPRVTAVDLAITSSATGKDVLHTAVKYKSVNLIKAAMAHGADPYVKDISGQSANDMASDEQIRTLLRQLAHAGAENSLALQQAPLYRGFMDKWTNYVHGYKVRWFVLENGVLSYYRGPDDEGRQARGVMHLRYVTIVPDRKERNRFEIINSKGKDATRWFLRSSDAAECTRWIQLLEKTRQFYCQGDVVAGDSSAKNPRVAESNSPVHYLSAVEKGEESGSRPASIAGPPVDDDVSEIGSIDESGLEQEPGAMPYASNFTRVNNLMDLHFEVVLKLLNELDMDAAGHGSESTGQSMTMTNGSQVVIPTASESGQAAQPVVLGGVANQVTGTGNSGSQIRSALRRSLEERVHLWKEFSKMVRDREAYLTKELERANRTCQLWEEQMTVLGGQHRQLEDYLHEAASENKWMRRERRQFVSNMPTTEEPESMTKEQTDTGSVSAAVGATAGAVSATAGAAAGMAGSMLSKVMPFNWNARQESMDEEDEFFDTVDSDNIPNLHVEEPLSRQGTMSSGLDTEDATKDESAPQPSAEQGAAGVAGEQVSQGADESKKEEEPPKDNNQSQDTEGAATEASSKHFLEGPGYEPYKHLRQKMPIGKDERPAMSLWSILKNNIGKDLTKISFPVAFNEPTSMLQRMSEDLEFSECLDAAALQSDSTRRIMYVAAFAMSNYSSTIGRIAKPFNPMLGETFEYISVDGQYRYISEQVSHHPPISACFCESPGWEYMGCVDAKSRFLGRSFEITPTGVAHVRLKVKPEWVSAEKRNSLPPSPDNDGLLMEHYSWNKVTTSVSGFITGSTTIDHFGDMNVVNHVTGDKCTLTFMPRGWRSSNAYEIKGHVTSASGNKVWDIAGRWNSQLLARRSNSQGGLNPDSKHSGADPVASSKNDNEYLLLWRNSVKTDTPFNLTPFAVTLNSKPDGLTKWLPPTDCRLRPDLAAFEVGKFNDADRLKVELENLQRSTRRKREEGQLPPHKPRWFTKTTDSDTSAAFWKPQVSKDSSGRETIEYWIERDRVGSKRMNNEPAQWEGCDPIFGEASK
ncbi:hypothetical protein MCAP1_000750 [Malassezia caprae]|uniref:PH domain-containing protein n=1 Tax=Malassezia caprae TaxID=1381934 RepID=A0AAF0IUB3_9BASI|nr:hypothetical protein MCAP1_000750 [Malassezia caprae]